ncbi:MAG: cellulase family glycosylhydrolase [Candidatus Aminicenantia bacterium]
MIKKILFASFIFFFSFFSFAQQDPSLYGINAHIPDSRVLSMIKNAGIKWIRIDFLWYEIEPKNNYFNWSIIDSVVNNARSKGLSILGVLAYTPSWANNGKGKNFPPSKKAYWKDYVKKVVNRYKNRVEYWTFWNEPNLEEFWASTVDKYVNEILIPGANAAKSVDPTCKIVGPDLAHLSSEEARWNVWLRAILREGGKERLDVISHHIYDKRGPTYIFDKLENDQYLLEPSVIKVLQEEGVDNKPFWITETGWNTDEIGEEIQSKYYLEFLQGMRSRVYINKIFFYEIIDDPRANVPHFGIIYSNYTPKKAYYTYKDFIAGKYPPEEPPPSDDNQCPIITSLEEEEKEEENKLGEKVNLLRSVRDNILKKTIKGNQLIDFYYKYAPEVNSILLVNSYARELALKCLQPFLLVSQEIISQKEIEKDRLLSKQDIEHMLELSKVLKIYGSPELVKMLNHFEKEIVKHQNKSISQLILKLDFNIDFLTEDKIKK